MRPVNAAMQAVREARGLIIEIPMVWIEARHRDTNVVEGIGFWKGEDAETITVTDLFTGVAIPRVFYAGGLLDIGAVRHEAGLTIRPVSLTLSGISPAVLIAFREYEARGARVQAWKRGYDPETRAPIGVEPWFKGFINRAPTDRPAPGGLASMSVEVVSAARMLTQVSGRKKSDAEQRKREHEGTPDRIRRYKNTAGSWDVPWGNNLVRA